MTLTPAEHHRIIRHPYYIYAPGFSEGSSGIRVLHYLCHILNMCGYEAYIQAATVSEQLWTPQLDTKIMERHYLNQRKPIVIYPEVVRGTPLGLGVKVRWLLNTAGEIAGHHEFDEDEIRIGYREAFVRTEDNIAQLLTVPTSDPNIFNPGLPQEKRNGKYFYYNRLLARGGKLMPATEGAIEISSNNPRPFQELAEIFKRAEVLYSYEHGAITIEARMCGCPVVYVPNPTMLPERPKEDWGRIGVAWGLSEEEIKHAQDTVADFFPEVLKLYERFAVQLEAFIQLTQSTACATTFESCYPLLTIQKHGWAQQESYKQNGESPISNTKIDANYNAWLRRTSLQEIDGQLVAERMMKRWKQRPKFNIVIEARVGEENLLADSIDSIDTQWYPDWHLTLITDFQPTDPAINELPQITWLVRSTESSIKDSIDTAISRTPGNWLLLLEPGNIIAAHTLAYFADTINLEPDTRLLYCDEDTISGSGAHIAPKFKPDINLELLRNMYYLGPALAVERQAFIRTGGWSQHGDAALYDISLRILDDSGTNALSHQRDMLLHTPEKSLRPIDTASEQACLYDHLLRNNVTGKIESGFLTGTQKLTYPPQGTPLVSIIIPTKDQPGYLSHCIDSLAKQTHYQHWELIVVDHDTQDPDALDYLSNLNDTQPFTQHIEVVRTSGEFNYSRLCNLGTSLAKGDFLLFLDNDTEIIQPSWLDDMLGYLQQPGVAAAAPRLSKPDSRFSIVEAGPRMLGLGGLAIGMSGDQTSLIEPGYCGRLQVAQDVSALNGSCVMVSAKAFNEIQGMNENDTSVFEGILDLCIRLRREQYRLIWTPWVDVIHHVGITRKRLDNDMLSRAHLTEQALAERDYFYLNNLAELADDPYYHRHLSLQSPFAIEPNAVIDWDNRFHDRLRILGQPLTSGSGEYRMTAPFRALQKAGMAQTNIVHPLGHKIQRVLTPIELARAAPDVLMLQQAIDDTQINQLKRYRQFSPDIFVTYAVDDVLGNLPRKHYLYNFQAREGKSRMREGLAHCDRLIASTEPIAEYCKGMISDIIVVPNCLEEGVWLGHESKRGQGNKPRVGWAGAQQHLGDLELIKDVVESLANEVEWIFMGMCPDFLKPFVAEEHAFVSFTDYPAKLASLNLDLAIAPLEQHLFNEGKSNLRLLEYGAMGWPVVCTDIYPYQTNNAPVKRVNNVAGEWIAAIRDRINDLPAAYEEGEILRKWVLEHYILENRVEDWLIAATPS